MFICIVCIDQSKLIDFTSVLFYSRFRLRGASARMALKKAWRVRMVFGVHTMAGLLQTSGHNWKPNDAFTKDSAPNSLTTTAVDPISICITMWHEIFAGPNFCNFFGFKFPWKFTRKKFLANIFSAKIYCTGEIKHTNITWILVPFI